MWLLEWCADEGFHGEDMPHDDETFKRKAELLERLDELKFRFGDDLEYRFGKAKAIKITKYVFDNHREQSKEGFFEDKLETL